MAQGEGGGGYGHLRCHHLVDEPRLKLTENIRIQFQHRGEPLGGRQPPHPITVRVSIESINVNV